MKLVLPLRNNCDPLVNGIAQNDVKCKNELIICKIALDREENFLYMKA